MKKLITLTVLLIQHLVFSQTISPVLEHFTSVGGIDEWSLITGQSNTGAHGSELCVNVSGNYLDNQYYSFESPIYDLTLWSEVDLLFSVVQNTRGGDLLYLYYFDSADSQWWGWDISGLNGVYLVSVPITTILFSIDFNTNSNGNINGKYFHIDYIDIMDPSVSLPIELLFFSAIINDGKGELMWATESEINNDYFLIERSKDAEEWVEVITTKGLGNSNMVNGYFEIDNEPLMGVFYYRLTQVNFNGEKEIFNIVPVENITNGEGVMDIFPNPLTKGDCINLLFKNIDCIGNQEILVVLRDIKGKEVYSKIEIVDCDDGLIAIDIAGNLPSGAYLVIATSNNILYSKKVIIKDSIKK